MLLWFDMNVVTIAGTIARTIALGVVACVFGCGSELQDYEGASNTDDLPVIPNACEQLSFCCYAVPAAEQPICFAGAKTGDDLACTSALGERRAQGICPSEATP